jgi:hypothetical protein
MFNGEPGAVPKVIGHWMLRSVLIMPGLALAGVRDKRLLTGALLSSTFVSLFLIAYTAFERNRRGRRKRSLGSARQARGRLAGKGRLGTRYRVTVRSRHFKTPTALCIEAKNKSEASSMIDTSRGTKIVRITRGC